MRGLREIEPAHAAIVLRIFLEYDAGISPIEICRRLNAEGIPSPRGTTWGPSSLIGSGPIASGLLRNRFYTGVYVWRRTTTRKRNGKVKMSPGSEENRIATEHPHLKIIDQDLFDRVQARIERGGTAPFREVRIPDYLFSGKYRCGVCGESIVIMNKRLGCIGTNRKGVCNFSRRVPREDVEDAVLSKIATYVVGSPHLDLAIAAFRAEADRAAAEHAEAAGAAGTELPKLEQRRSKLVRYALDFLSKRGHAHAVRASPTTTGWVWNNTGISDSAWKQRALGKASGTAPPPSPRSLFADPVALSWSTSVVP